MVIIDDDDWEGFREKANEWAEEMADQFRLARIAYANNDGHLAKQHSERAKYCRKLMEEANESAANMIFDINNENRSIDVIDLHGLYKAEAIAELKERINYAAKKGVSKLTVIVGQGHHSESGPILKPAVVEFASRNFIPFSFPNKNSGRVDLNLRQFTTNDYSDDSDNNVYNEKSSNTLSSPFTTYSQRAYKVSSSVTPCTSTSADSSNSHHTGEIILYIILFFFVAIFLISSKFTS